VKFSGRRKNIKKPRKHNEMASTATSISEVSIFISQSRPKKYFSFEEFLSHPSQYTLCSTIHYKIKVGTPEGNWKVIVKDHHGNVKHEQQLSLAKQEDDYFVLDKMIGVTGTACLEFTCDDQIVYTSRLVRFVSRNENGTIPQEWMQTKPTDLPRGKAAWKTKDDKLNASKTSRKTGKSKKKRMDKNNCTSNQVASKVAPRSQFPNVDLSYAISHSKTLCTQPSCPLHIDTQPSLETVTQLASMEPAVTQATINQQTTPFPDSSSYQVPSILDPIPFIQMLMEDRKVLYQRTLDLEQKVLSLETELSKKRLREYDEELSTEKRIRMNEPIYSHQEEDIQYCPECMYCDPFLTEDEIFSFD
jgi:hypothetical protein